MQRPAGSMPPEQARGTLDKPPSFRSKEKDDILGEGGGDSSRRKGGVPMLMAREGAKRRKKSTCRGAPPVVRETGTARGGRGEGYQGCILFSATETRSTLRASAYDHT